MKALSPIVVALLVGTFMACDSGLTLDSAKDKTGNDGDADTDADADADTDTDADSDNDTDDTDPWYDSDTDSANSTGSTGGGGGSGGGGSGGGGTGGGGSGGGGGTGGGSGGGGTGGGSGGGSGGGGGGSGGWGTGWSWGTGWYDSDTAIWRPDTSDTSVAWSLVTCTNDCNYAGDGMCDDGGPGSLFSVCDYGSDCEDCGPRLPDCGNDVLEPKGSELCDGTDVGTMTCADLGIPYGILLCNGSCDGYDTSQCSQTQLCDDTCTYANDGVCDDGGPGSVYSVCSLGTDCTDCGPR
ncbi:MAG: hypothetical protein HN348_10145 [Proteobacteria bacterium]|nr:hypothetical protein [Pseudomonadota bacterium]